MEVRWADVIGQIVSFLLVCRCLWGEGGLGRYNQA